MRCNRKLNRVLLVLCLALLTFGFGYVTARPQTRKQKAIKNPPKEKTAPKSKESMPTQTKLKLSPTSGPPSGGNQITITGSGFNDKTEVSFGGLPADIIEPVEPGTITVVVPSQAKLGPVAVVITTPGRKALRARYQYKVISTIPPITVPVGPSLGITRIDPGSGSPNKDINLTIYGKNFTSLTEVQIEGRLFAPILKDPGVMNVFIPSGSYGAGTVDVVVKNRGTNDMFNMVDGFTFIGPKIFWIEPSRGAAKGGEHVRIYGRYLKFRNLADVLFGNTGITAGKPSEDDEHTLYVDTPPHEPGWVDVVVYNSYGQRTILPKAYYYEESKTSGAGAVSYPKLLLSLERLYVEEDGNSEKGSSWSFEIRLNSIHLCDLESRWYSSARTSEAGVPAYEAICRQEVRVEENELRVRIIGTRGDAWLEGATTVPLDAISGLTDSTGPSQRSLPIIHVRANNEKKGHFVFLMKATRIE